MSEIIGALRSRVTLQSPQSTPDELGGAALTWTNQGEAWASVDALSARQAAAFDANISTAAFRVVIRRREDVRAGWRALWGARTLRVVGVRDGGGRSIDLICEEERT